MKARYFLLCILLSSLILPAADIVKDGRAMAEIIPAASADPSIRTAAEELRKYIGKMTGASLEIVPAPTGRMPVRIFVGAGDHTRKMKIDLSDIRHDGFKIVVKGDDIVVAGRDFDWYNKLKLSEEYLYAVQKKWERTCGHQWRSPMFIYSLKEGTRSLPRLPFHIMNGTGTLSGVYHLLEQFGFRWYVSFSAPDEDLGKVIPRLGTLSLPDGTIRKEPEFANRIYGYYVSNIENALWVKYLGVGQTELLVPIHMTGRLMDYHEDPELAGTVNGKLCWTAPKLSGEKFRSSFMEYLDAFNRFYPVRMPMTSFGSPDGWTGIDDKDRADGWDRLATRGEAGRYSDYYWDFLLDIRERYNKKYPFGKSQRKHIYAYGGTNRIPEILERKGARVPEDFTVFFTYHSDKIHLPGYDYRPRLKEWHEKIDSPRQLICYDYYYEHTKYKGERPPLPYIFTENLKKEFQLLYDKCDGWLLEGMISDYVPAMKKFAGFYRPAINSPMFYLRNKMSWDRNLDPGEELTDMCRRYYGPAGRKMRELYSLAEKIWMRQKPRMITAHSGYLTKEDIPALMNLLKQARQEVPAGSVYARRIAKLAEEMKTLPKCFENLARRGPQVRGFRFTDNAEPKIDGDLTKNFWQWKSRKAPAPYRLRNMHTGNYPPHLDTNVSFRWHGGQLYVGIECLEPKMNRIKSSATARDDNAVYMDDNVEIALETTGGRCPLIVLNPNGTILDTDKTMPNTEDLPHFYTVRNFAVKKLPDRWTAELEIDFRELGSSMPNRTTPCGIQISRQRLAGNTTELYMLSPTGSRFNDHREMMANLFVQ